MKFFLRKIFILSFLILILNSCTNNFQEVTGQIISIESSELNKISKLTLKDFDREIWVFNGNNKSYSHFTSHHLKEHQVSGHPVIMIYEKIGEQLSIVSIEDGDENGH